MYCMTGTLGEREIKPNTMRSFQVSSRVSIYQGFRRSAQLEVCCDYRLWSQTNPCSLSGRIRVPAKYSLNVPTAAFDLVESTVCKPLFECVEVFLDQVVVVECNEVFGIEILYAQVAEVRRVVVSCNCCIRLTGSILQAKSVNWNERCFAKICANCRFELASLVSILRCRSFKVHQCVGFDVGVGRNTFGCKRRWKEFAEVVAEQRNTEGDCSGDIDCYANFSDTDIAASSGRIEFDIDTNRGKSNAFTENPRSCLSAFLGFGFVESGSWLTEPVAAGIDYIGSLVGDMSKLRLDN